MNGTSNPFLRIALRVVLTLIVGGVPAVAAAAPPVLTVPGAQTVNENELLTFTVSASDPDGQTCDMLVSSRPSGATFGDNGNNTGTFRWTPTPSQVGTYVVTFTADDTFGGIDTESVSIEVRSVNAVPVLDPIADRSVERGGFLALLATGSDDDGDALSFRATGMPSFGALTDNGDGSASLVFTPGTAAPLGATTITVFLSDGTEEVSTSFQLTVTSSTATSPPVLNAIGSRTVTEGSSSSITISASDSDGDALTWTVSLPGFADFTVTQSSSGASTGRLDLAPGLCDAGSHPATVSVSDGSGSDSESFSITVLDANRAPAWQVPTGGFALSLTAGTSATLNVAASDPDQSCGGPAPALSVSGSNAGDQLTLSLASAGSGAGVLHVGAGSDASGDFEVTLRATDGAVSSSFQETTVAVHVTGVPALLARSWFEKDPLRLDIGRPRERAYLEPKHASFNVFNVVLASIRLRAWEGAGTVDEIVPVEGRFLFSDRDQNMVFDLRMDFGKEDLRALLANVTNHEGVPLKLTATLTDGREVQATLIHDLIPDTRERVIKKVGPNPLNPEATIVLTLPADGTLTVRVYDLSGRLVRTIVDGQTRVSGDHEIRFDGKDDRGVTLPSGRYFVRADIPGGSDSRAITVVK